MSKKNDFHNKTDEWLIEVYKAEAAASEKIKQAIQTELQRRYYPFYDPKQPGVAQKGVKFKKLVFATLRRYGVRNEDLNQFCEIYCESIFNALFLNKKGFDDLLNTFNSSKGSFLNWAVYVRIRSAIIDKLRKEVAPLDHETTWEEVQNEQVGGFSGDSFSSFWWDDLLSPKHGQIIYLLHFAYRELHAGYLNCMSRETNKSKEQLSQELTYLKRGLRPEQQFGKSEAQEVMILEKILKADQLNASDPEDEMFRSSWQEILNVVKQDKKIFRIEAPANFRSNTLTEMIWQSFPFNPVVKELKQLFRRWINFLEGELVEGTLLALTQEMKRRQNKLQQIEDYLRREGLDDHNIEILENAARTDKLQNLEKKFNQVVPNDELARQKILFQEEALRLHNLGRKRDKSLKKYQSGKFINMPLQREIGKILNLEMGTVGNRIAQAKSALAGATIWRSILNELRKFPFFEASPHRTENLSTTQVLSSSGDSLVVGVPKESLGRWWNLILHCIELVLTQQHVKKVMEMFKKDELNIAFRVAWDGCLTLVKEQNDG